ncbi:MAG: N-acetylmuramoyl-L-alanine amidase [Clostridiales bacterium]|nr:N-acetylmuramoyl-L-alanine amidase [Clostridiales bacterium]
MSKAEIARRQFIAKCIIAVCMTLVLGGGVFLLFRSGLFSKSSSKKETTITTTAGTVVTTAATSASDVTSGTTALPEDLTGYTVILDPGHGGWDRGTSYPYNSDQNEEPTITIRIANILADELRGRGATVYITRTEDNYYSLYYRIAEIHLICMDIAKERGISPFSSEREQELRAALQKIKEINDNSYDKGGMGFMAGTGVGSDLKELFEMEYQLPDVVLISIHINAHYDDNTHEPVNHHGIEVTYVTDDAVNEYESKPKNQTAGAPVRDAYHGRPNEHNLLYAQTLYDAIVAGTPDLKSNMDKPVYTANWAVIRKVGLVGTLLEFGFISHETDRAILLDDAQMRVVCASVADGIEEYFKQIR